MDSWNLEVIEWEMLRIWMETMESPRGGDARRTFYELIFVIWYLNLAGCSNEKLTEMLSN